MGLNWVKDPWATRQPASQWAKRALGISGMVLFSVVGTGCSAIPGLGGDDEPVAGAVVDGADAAMTVADGPLIDTNDDTRPMGDLTTERIAISDLRSDDVGDAIPVSAGQLLDIELDGWESGSEVTISIEPSRGTRTVFTADARGIVSGLYPIAVDAAPGFHQLRIVGPDGDSRRVRTAVLEVSGIIREGQPLGQFSQGFAPHELVEVQFMNGDFEYVQADAEGTVFVSATVPEGALDASFRFTGETTGVQEAVWIVDAEMFDDEAVLVASDEWEFGLDPACDALHRATLNFGEVLAALEPDDADLTVTEDWRALQAASDSLDEAAARGILELHDAAAAEPEWEPDLVTYAASEAVFWAGTIDQIRSNESHDVFDAAVSTPSYFTPEAAEAIDAGRDSAANLNTAVQWRCGLELGQNY